MPVTMRQIRSVLLARWRLVVSLFGLMTLGAISASLMQPPRYTASARMMIEFKADPVSAAAFGGMAPPALMASQGDVIRSDRVAQRVMALLALDKDERFRQAWCRDSAGTVSLERWIVARLREQMSVHPAREGNLISIAYTANEPALAADLANAFMQAYIEVALELRTDPASQYSGFFESRSKAARTVLEEAQSRLSGFQARHGIVAADERLDVENARLNELSSQLSALQGVAAESSSRLTQSQGASAERLQEVVGNPVLAQIKAEMRRAEAQLQQLSTRLGDSHPQVIEARANLGLLRARLETETRQVAGGVGVVNAINLQREEQVRSNLAEQRSRVLEMKSVRAEGAVLQRDVENAQRAYDNLQQKLSQVSLESQNTQGNVNVLERAEIPVDRASPKLWLNALLGALLGAISAVAAALLMEMRDRRVRSGEDVTELLGLPQLGALARPEVRGLRARTSPGMSARLITPFSSTANRS